MKPSDLAYKLELIGISGTVLDAFPYETQDPSDVYRCRYQSLGFPGPMQRYSFEVSAQPTSCVLRSN